MIFRRILQAVLVGWIAICAAIAWAGPGAEIYNEYLEKGLIYPDDEWQDYVTEIGERLLAVSPHKGRNYTFTVTDQSEVNAFATEDAFVFVTRGILAHFNSEDELAAVIGHEIGHVVGRHAPRRNSRVKIGQLLGWIGSLATGTSATGGLANSVTAAAASSYGRQYELEADEFGATWLAKAGYSPRGLLDSIQMLSDHTDYQNTVRKVPPVYHGIFGSHPAHAKRINELVQQSQHLFPDELIGPERDFFMMVDGLAYGDEAAEGVIKDGVYYHGRLRLAIRFPEGWDVNSTAREVYGADSPQAGNSDGRIGVRRQNPPDSAQSPEEYLTETLRRDDLKNGQAIQIGPYEGYIADIELADNSKQARKIAVVYKDGGVFLFDGELGANGDPEQFNQQFIDTVGSFRAMTAEDQRLINNQKLKIVVAKPGQTYEDLARGVPLRSYPVETLRVINGHHPNGQPRAGDYIKLVQ